MTTTTDETTDANAGWHDTIALLQEEIARLEAELQLREDESAALATPTPRIEDENPTAAGDTRAADLAAELAERDRMIELLWEQVTILEEAESAGRAEWEQLHQWVEELERRVEGNGDGQGEQALQRERDRARRDAEAATERFESDRRAWHAQRASLDSEIAALQSRLDEAAAQKGPDELRATLERENRQLHHTRQRLAAAEAVAASADTLRNELQDARGQLQDARQELSRTADDLQRQRLEHQAELATLRARLVRETQGAATTGELGVNERMRALREHLNDLHKIEEQERRNRRLSARISKLWGRTGPAR